MIPLARVMPRHLLVLVLGSLLFVPAFFSGSSGQARPENTLVPTPAPADLTAWAEQRATTMTAQAPPPPTETPNPTNTPIPTNTPTQVTEPVEAQPQQPAPIPAESLSLGVDAYTSAVTDGISSLQTASFELADLFENANMQSDQWKVDVAVWLVTIQMTHEVFAGMPPPPEFEEFHSLLLDATADCYRMTEHVISGIDNVNTTEIEIAGDYMVSCGEKMEEANQYLEEHFEF